VVLASGRADFSGRSQPYKGIETVFLEAARRLREDDPRVFPVFAGKGDDRAAEALTAAGVLTCLNLPAEELPRALAAADLYLSTSRWEGFDLPLAEAQFQGTPAVAFDAGAHGEVVAHGESGLLVERDEELVSSALSILSDEQRLCRMGKAARAHLSFFSWRENVRGLLQLAEEARSERAAAGVTVRSLPRSRAAAALRRRWDRVCNALSPGGDSR
jgi:glycosyltransferase involved in cell wall biosynthesis